MKNKPYIKLAISIATISSLLIAPVYASQGIYVGANVGMTKQASLTYRDIVGTSFLETKGKEGGLGVGGAVGYQWDNNYRIEGAFDYLKGKVKSATIDAGGPALNKSDPGKIRAGAAMINGLYDFNTTSDWTTYLGVGAGTVHISHRIDIDPDNNSHGSATKFAYQGILGTSFRLSDYVRANMDYRYLRSSPSSFDVLDDGVIISMKSKYKIHRITIGLNAFL